MNRLMGVEEETLREPLLGSDERLGANNVGNDEHAVSPVGSFFYETLLPDQDWKIFGKVVVEGGFSVKLTKFLLLTIGGIYWLHWLVSHRQGHRDEELQAWQIWVFDMGLIVRDAVIFFLVGRLWHKRGVDHWAWAGTVLACNAFLEMQHYVPWLQHSLTMYEMHCSWSWQTWAYMGLCLLFSSGVTGLHILRAWREKVLLMKATEVALFAFCFLAPVVTSPYFHFHHWFAGWLVGMHFNFDVWWSTAAMAWCHGLYINGIAVYGRDPVLTCDYAYFLSWDQECPFLECHDGMDRGSGRLAVDYCSYMAMSVFGSPNEPADWRNCSDDR
jgi:hypothetical protein